MAILKHVWAGASVLATLVTCVLAQNSGADAAAAFLRAIKGDAFTANATSVVIQPWVNFGPASEEQTVPPVVPNTTLGRIDVYEVNITNSSDPNATAVGTERAFIFLESSGYENQVTEVFNNNSGFPTNSSINFAGFEPLVLPPEGYNYTVVGGTRGAFACARGVATDFLFTFNDTADTATFFDIIHMVVGCGFDTSNAFYLFFGSPEP